MEFDILQAVAQLREGERPIFPSSADQSIFARQLDRSSDLSYFRDDFIIPTKAQLKIKSLSDWPQQIPVSLTSAAPPSPKDEDSEDSSIYFCGNSLGVQPKAVNQFLQSYLQTWSSIGVHAHFRQLADSPLTSFQDLAEDCARKMADIVGAAPDEIVAMNTLTVNLHLMMASFYKPTAHRNKIILEWRPFPSDYYAIESQIRWHGYDPADAMVKIEPEDGTFLLSIERILQVIDEHKDDAALLLLPGVQYYSGQLLDIPKITKHAQAHNIVVGWDLAHAAGNVELQLHDWNVDFAAWCTYKYMNAGAGAIGAAFVHAKHGAVRTKDGDLDFRPRLTGWYGGDKSVRFKMDNKFVPSPGAAGFQLSNPSAIDLTALSATLSVFNKTTMKHLRSRSLLLTAYTEILLLNLLSNFPGPPPFSIITPSNPLERGTQLSLLLRENLLDVVSERLEDGGVVCDKRKPGVIRVAPTALYNTFEEVWTFVRIFGEALKDAIKMS